MVKYRTKGQKTTAPPINTADFDRIVRDAIDQMFEDGSRTVNIRHICVIAGWDYNLSNAHRISCACKKFGLQRADTKRALFIKPQTPAEECEA